MNSRRPVSPAAGPFGPVAAWAAAPSLALGCLVLVPDRGAHGG